MSDTYVHTDLELLDILPMFAGGSKLNILVCIGLFDTDPVGASFNDLLVYTGMTRMTIVSAVQFLIANGFIGEKDGYYHPLKFIRFESGDKKNISSHVSTYVRTKNKESTYAAKNFQRGVNVSNFEEQIEELDKPKKLPKGYTFSIAMALAEVCNVQFEPNRGKMLSEAKKLLQGDPVPTPELIRERYGKGQWWYSNDWRGKRGQEPNTAAIRETWGKWSVPEKQQVTINPDGSLYA